MNLIVEGWRFIPHSYAIVNQFQLLEFLLRKQVRVYHNDMPFYQPHWQPKRGLFSPEQEERLAAVPSAAVQPGDVVLRMNYPHTITPHRNNKVFVFMTAEMGNVSQDCLSNPLSQLDTSVVIVTPSYWSRQGIINAGAPADRVFVVPHGVDASIFRPVTGEVKAALRKKYKLDEGFIFFNAGAMTGNKGIGFLLKAFAAVARLRPAARLLLKGLDAIYGSKSLLRDMGEMLSAEEKKLVASRLVYFGGSYSFTQVAELYQLCDAYVSPYLGEGFNLPVLEAAACGLPVICTQGGPTDEFTTAAFAYHIASERKQVMRQGEPYYYLEPQLEHLIQHMNQCMEDAQWRAQAQAAGPQLVQDRFLWRHAVDRWLELMARPGK